MVGAPDKMDDNQATKKIIVGKPFSTRKRRRLQNLS